MASPFHLTSDNKVTTRAQAKAFARIVISGVTVAAAPEGGSHPCDSCGAWAGTATWGITATIPYVGAGTGGDCSYEGLVDSSPLKMHGDSGELSTQARVRLNRDGAVLKVLLESDDPSFAGFACGTNHGIKVFEGSYASCIGGEVTVTDTDAFCTILSSVGHGGTATVSFCD